MSHPRTGRALIAALAASILVATACSGGTPTASSAPSAAGSATAAASPTPQQGGRIVEGTISDIATMQPVLVNDTSSGRITGLMYDGLIQQDAKSGEVKPKLASYTTSTDGLTYTFTINDKANWSDGKPIIAQDWLTGLTGVAKSAKTVRKSSFQDIAGFNEFCAPAGAQCKATATSISGVTLDPANPKKFSVKMTKVSCPAILDLSGYTIPTQVFGKYLTATSKAEDFDNAAENTAPTVFSGPFKFKEWRKGDQIILGKNETYWQGSPNVDEYVYKVVADATVLAAQLKTGELNLGTVEPKDLADIEAQENLKVTKTSQLGYTYIGWRTDSKSVPALGDKKVRQALAYGLNMDDVIKAVLFGQGTKQVAHHVPVQWAYPDPKSLNQYAFDAKKAEQLIQEAGYKKNAGGIYEKDGKPISFTIRTNAGNKTRETLAQVASEQYKKIGIDAKTNFEQFQGLVDKLTAGDASIEAVIIGWSLGTSVDPYSIWHSSQIPDPATKTTGFGFTAFKSTELDNAIVQGRNPTNGDCSIATRKKHYETFNKLLNEEQPYNFGFSSVVLNVTQKNMQNYDPGSFSTYYNLHEWWFKKS
jgi:peptide/nickel transport system substrate-binding protein